MSIYLVKDVCILPKIVGPCRAAMSRWHFSKTSKKCEEFTYGGCHGNGNNFRSKDECENKCEAKKNANVCSLPRAEGICLGYFVRWYYDVKSKKCKKFVYGGCQGNANRFMTRKECDIACGAGTTGTRTLINKLGTSKKPDVGRSSSDLQ